MTNGQAPSLKGGAIADNITRPETEKFCVATQDRCRRGLTKWLTVMECVLGSTWPRAAFYIESLEQASAEIYAPVKDPQQKPSAGVDPVLVQSDTNDVAASGGGCAHVAGELDRKGTRER